MKSSTTVLSGVNVAVVPSLNVTVAVPFSDTTTVLAFGLTFLISASTLPLSSSVNDEVFLTGVLAGSTNPFDCASTTVLSGVNVAVVPSLNVTVAVPFSDTTTVLAFGLTFLISASTLPLSSSVNDEVFLTGVLAGSTNPFDCASTTVLSGVNVAVVPSLNVTVAVPFLILLLS
ncbi:conserved domain protein [Streptococcus mitis SK1080]|uniref:Conserved domain protein n=1 Tax=Streptococcus mitis SK1080 TaxID=1008453 RepID=F9HK10_STRMT|nr:conserved domain protein [Streptococcus mitis SK1080]